MAVIQPQSIPINNQFSPAMASRCGESSYDPQDLSSADEEYIMLNNVAEVMPRRTDYVAWLTTAARLYLNAPPELPKNSELISPNHDVYHSDQMVISSRFGIMDITDWWCQQDKMHTMHAKLSNLAHDIFSILPYSARVEASVSIG